MKVTFLCCVLLLAGTASCSPVEAKSINLPSWFPDVVIPDNVLEWITEQINNFPDSLQNIIDKIPDIIAAIPGILDRLEEIVESIIVNLPEIIPALIDQIPQIIAQYPEAIEKIREILRTIAERIPETIPIILEKIPEIVAALPDVLDTIKEVLEGLDLPDWFPTLPGFEFPENWPENLPTMPEYNQAVPGIPTTIDEFPGIVQVEVGTGPVWVQGCAGGILTNYHIVSSARCFSSRSYSPRYRRVRAGSSSRFVDGTIVYVQSSINHPSFGDDGIGGDISVVRLGNNLVLSPTIQQIPIVPEGFSLPSGIAVTLAGFGTTAQGGQVSDRGLYSIDLQVTDQAECRARWAKIPLFQIGQDKFCVGRPETGGRNGDVRDIGSPVVYGGILSGVVSLGTPVGNQHFPVIVTSIGSYTTWIIANAV